MGAPFHTPSDAATAQVQSCAGSADRPGLVIATTILASSLAFIDGSVVNVGLPAIGANFQADAGRLQWVVNAYLLPLSALLLLGGAAGEAATQGLQLLARGLQLLHEAAPQVQAELAEHVQAAQRLLRPAAPGVLGP